MRLVTSPIPPPPPVSRTSVPHLRFLGGAIPSNCAVSQEARRKDPKGDESFAALVHDGHLMWRYINGAIIVRSSKELDKENTYFRVVREVRRTTARPSGDGQPRPSWLGQRPAGDD